MSLALFLFAAVAPNVQPKAEDSDFSVKQTRQMLERYGQCVVKGQVRRAAEAILANRGNDELTRRYPSLLRGECLSDAADDIGSAASVQARFSGDQYRYALADALVRVELAALPAPSLDGVPKLDHRDPGEPPSQLDRRGHPLRASRYEELLKGYTQERAANYLSRYGECVVRLDPSGARRLLLSQVETPEETAAFTAIHEALATCLAEGATMAFSKVTLRGTIAVNYYRLSKAALAETQSRVAK